MSYHHSFLWGKQHENWLHSTLSVTIWNERIQQNKICTTSCFYSIQTIVFNTQTIIWILSQVPFIILAASTDFVVVVVLRSPIHANEPSEYNGMLYRTSNRVLNNGIKVIILICMDGTSQYHHHRLCWLRTWAGQVHWQKRLLVNQRCVHFLLWIRSSPRWLCAWSAEELWKGLYNFFFFFFAWDGECEF